MPTRATPGKELDRVATVLRFQIDHNGLTKEGADLIGNFVRRISLERGIAPSTAAVRAKNLTSFLKSIPRPLQECSTDDVIGALAEARAKLSPTTFHLYLFVVKDFLAAIRPPGVVLAEVQKFKAGKQRESTKTAAQMLTTDEVRAILAAAKTSRDRALLAVLYEGGFRPVELARLTWGEVKFDEHGAIVNTSEKTGKPRYIRLILSAPALAAWKQDYPEGIGPGSRVFVRLRLEGGKHPQITVSGIAKVVRKAAKRAGIQKHIHPYLFRHSRITHMMEQQIPESVIKLQAWGSLSSPMLATYAHISNGHIDDVLLEKAGVVTPKEQRQRSIKPIQCPSCSTVNGPTASYCSVCGASLTDESKARQKNISAELRKMIAEDPEGFMKALREVGK
jgi:integrase/recombinase XerD